MPKKAGRKVKKKKKDKATLAAEAEEARVAAEFEAARVAAEEAAAAEEERLEQIRLAKVAAELEKARAEREAREQAERQAQLANEHEVQRRNAARARLAAHRTHFDVTVVEAKLWYDHPWHVYCAVTATPGPPEPASTSTLSGATTHPVWGEGRGDELEPGTDGDHPSASGETLRFECGSAFRAAIVPSVKVELCGLVEGVICAAEFSLADHCTRSFVDPETEARAAEQQARAEKRALRHAEREAELKAQALAKAEAEAEAEAVDEPDESASQEGVEEGVCAPGKVPPLPMAKGKGKKKKKSRKLTSQGSVKSTKSAKSNASSVKSAKSANSAVSKKGSNTSRSTGTKTSAKSQRSGASARSATRSDAETYSSQDSMDSLDSFDSDASDASDAASTISRSSRGVSASPVTFEGLGESSLASLFVSPLVCLCILSLTLRGFQRHLFLVVEAIPGLAAELATEAPTPHRRRAAEARQLHGMEAAEARQLHGMGAAEARHLAVEVIHHVCLPTYLWQCVPLVVWVACGSDRVYTVDCVGKAASPVPGGRGASPFSKPKKKTKKGGHRRGKGGFDLWVPGNWLDEVRSTLSAQLIRVTLSISWILQQRR
jgi:hypothetical protein